MNAEIDLKSNVKEFIDKFKRITGTDSNIEQNKEFIK
jgi:hypothetical protein